MRYETEVVMYREYAIFFKVIPYLKRVYNLLNASLP